jgi:hypothetical protein
VKTIQYSNYYAQDFKDKRAWVRMFCAPLPDEAVGLLLVQHHFDAVNAYFDHATEANIGLVCAGSMQHAMNMINQGQGHLGHNAAVVRRLSRLLSNEDLSDQIGNTVALRGLERAVAYSVDDDSGKKLAMFERAGWKADQRGNKTVWVLSI